jgi:hypothetical protein
MNVKNFTLIVAILWLFASCKSGNDEEVSFETITVEKTVNLSNEELSPKCNVSLKVQSARQKKGEAAQKINEYLVERLFNLQDVTVEAAAKQFTDAYILNYKNTLLPLYNQDRSDTTKRAWYDYHYIITTETNSGNENTIVYLATIDYYEGTAHGINQLLTMNFDKNTGRHVTLGDIFATGYEQQLTAKLLKALKEKTGSNDLAELKEKGYLNAMDMFPTENFIIGEETLTFIYNPYEIAPYNLGTTELIIPYSDIETILKTTFDY